MTEEVGRVDLLLSAQRAFLDAVSTYLRAVTIRVEESVIYLSCFYDGPVSSEDKESAEVAATEVIADFPGYEIVTEILRVDAPQPLPDNGFWVFKRREET